MSDAAGTSALNTSSLGQGLARDPIVRLQCAVLLLVAIPYFLPGVTSYRLWDWAVLSEVPLLVVTLVAFRLGLNRLVDPAERRFWNLWSLAIVAWLAKTVVLAVWIQFGEPGIGFEVATNCVFFLFYFLAAMALESRPNLSESPLARGLRIVERLGTFVFFTGLLLYLAIVPAVLELDSYVTSGLVLYVFLDGYLIVRLGGFLRGTRAPIWRRTYSWLLVTACLWLITDTIEMLGWAGPLAWMEEGTLVDLLWLPPWLTLVAAARVRQLPAAETTRPEKRLDFLLGPLVAFTVAVPILHISFFRTGVADPEVRPILEVLALVMLISLAALVVIRQELLRGETRRLDAQRERDQRQIEHLAFHDSLTGVPNRRLMTDRLEVGLERGLRFRRKVAVLLLDIDNFKLVNDTWGHDVGDSVLREVAQRMEKCVRGGDTVARFGGDEFVAVIEGLEASKDAARAVESIGMALAEPFEVAGESIEVTTTIGVAVFPDDASTPNDLLKYADVSMYRQRNEIRSSQAP